MEEENKNELFDILNKDTKESSKCDIFNKDFLSAWKKKINISKDLEILLKPLFDDIIDYVSNYLLTKDEIESTKIDKLYETDDNNSDNCNIFSLNQSSLCNIPFKVGYFIGKSEELALDSLNKLYTIEGLNKDVSGYYINVYEKSKTELILTLNGVFDSKIDVYANPNIDIDTIENLISAIFLDSGLHIEEDFNMREEDIKKVINNIRYHRSTCDNDEARKRADENIAKLERILRLKQQDNA